MRKSPRSLLVLTMKKEIYGYFASYLSVVIVLTDRLGGVYVRILKIAGTEGQKDVFLFKILQYGEFKYRIREG